MAVWNFTCGPDGTSYDLEVGATGLDSKYARPVGYGFMGDPAHPGLVFVGGAQPVAGSLKGTLLEQAEYDSLGSWWQKTYPVVITDRRRQWTVLITDLDRQRANKPLHPWFHQWSMNVDILAVTP